MNSLDEALRVLGLKTRAELQATADKLGEAYARVAGSAHVSLQDQAKAYATWRDAAVAAIGGVESGQLKLQGTILANRIAARGLGIDIEQGMQRGKTATDAATAAQERYNAALRADPSRLVSGNGLGGIKSGDVFFSANAKSESSRAIALASNHWRCRRHSEPDLWSDRPPTS